MNKIASAIFAIYISTLLFTSSFFVPMLLVAGKSPTISFLNQFGVFLAFFLLAFFVLHKHIGTFGNNLSLLLGSLALLGLIVSVFYHVVPIAPIYHIPKLIDPYFASTKAFTIWLIAPLVVLFF